jgi:lysophospholipase
MSLGRLFPLPLLLVTGLVATPRAVAIPERDYSRAYAEEVEPFLLSGERFTFRSADGKYDLSAIRFVHPRPKGIIVVVNGRSESWLKYGELFHDLYRDGYSVYSYDHRGQGLSPHLVATIPQLGHIDRFLEYSRDLNAFMEGVIRPVHPGSNGLFLIAHSMGAAVAAQVMETHAPPFEAAVFIAPMFEINTNPYPEALALGIVAALNGVGLGDRYAIGEHDDDPAAPFESNRVTSSRPRWEAMRAVWRNHPPAVIGGASNAWVEEALRATADIRGHLAAITTPLLLLQSGRDRLVINVSQQQADRVMQNCRLISFPEAKHEILMECDPIRMGALEAIRAFFGKD